VSWSKGEASITAPEPRLKTTPLSAEEIAVRCGFGTVSTFYRWFRSRLRHHSCRLSGGYEMRVDSAISAALVIEPDVLPKGLTLLVEFLQRRIDDTKLGRNQRVRGARRYSTFSEYLNGHRH
jgi:hypothetical protein